MSEINELIGQIGGRERLQEIYADGFLKHGESKLMASALLAVLEAQSKPALVLRPFGYDGETFIKSDIDHHAAVVYYRATPAASVPDGWKLVPVEPTAKMMVAGTLVSEFQEDPAGMYRSMIAAAPAPGDKK